MTAIVWKNGLLLVDSFIEKGGEWFEVSDKVLIVRREMQLVSQDGLFDDHILGITFTGAKWPVTAFGKALHEATLDMLKAIEQQKQRNPTSLIHEKDTVPYTYDRINARYEQAKQLGLINVENHFTALMIGAKHAYKVEIDPELGLLIEQVGADEVVTLGAGARYMSDLDKRNNGEATPIRMMHFAILMDGLCGGQILQFERLHDVRHASGISLALTGLYYEPATLPLKLAEAAACKPLQPDLVMNEESYSHIRRNDGDGDVAADAALGNHQSPETTLPPSAEEGTQDEPHQKSDEPGIGEPRERRNAEGKSRSRKAYRDRLRHQQAERQRSRADC